ncbi:hypothetical protein K432DRAFT_125070 [Lepidopterella palustris CBS 459.81]|uniref:DNA-directed RNA polymerase I subunit RPA34.5 n=1 Tax=Lepidopterella palustris CBS 459.81 TaxID=1314670 RepID=A0A8E2JJ32_9PEZI|nr:hypothetical protein K432DRAFT_125070 [Lepidopterella palustris CBS 459.81]
MKTVNVSKVPLPGLESQAIPKSRQKPAGFKSQEFVVDSDNESAGQANGKVVAAGKGKSAETSTPGLKQKAKTSGAPAAKPIRIEPSKPPKKSQAIYEVAQGKKRVPEVSRTASNHTARANGTAASKPAANELKPQKKSDVDRTMGKIEDGSRSNFRSTITEKDDSESDSEDESEDSGAESGKASGSQSGSEEEDSDGDGTEENSSADSTTEPPARSQAQTVQFRPPPPFEPPPDFNVVAAHPASSSNVLKMFNQSSISQKQIWHITAPANVPITSVKEIALEKAGSEEAILNHKGIDYGFNFSDKGADDTTKVLIPGPDGYRAVSARISQTLNLQQVVRLPNLSKPQADQTTGSFAAVSYTASSTKHVRQQPKGLRMRFCPSGFGDDDPGVLGSSDSEAEVEVRCEATALNGTKAIPRPDKRKREETNGNQHESANPTKKSKKAKDPEELRRKQEKKARKLEKERAKMAKMNA